MTNLPIGGLLVTLQIAADVGTRGEVTGTKSAETMPKLDFYYTLKPFLPAWLRFTARHWIAKKRRAEHASTWPINESAGTKPNGWPGWPDGKKFAFVLTH